MTSQRPNSPKASHFREGLVLGGGLGAAAGLESGKLIGFENIWLGAVLVASCTCMGGILAQKIASKW